MSTHAFVCLEDSVCAGACANLAQHFSWRLQCRADSAVVLPSPPRSLCTLSAPVLAETRVVPPAERRRERAVGRVRAGASRAVTLRPGSTVILGLMLWACTDISLPPTHPHLPTVPAHPCRSAARGFRGRCSCPPGTPPRLAPAKTLTYKCPFDITLPVS
jgi:hypothetical protein